MRLLFACLLATGPAFAQDVVLTDAEIAQVLRHGPWPQAVPSDPSNRVDGDAKAIAFGETLFHAPQLSSGGRFSCASCHNPALDFVDGLERAEGRKTLDRNTLALFNLGYQRWFGWDGRSDNLWAQSMVPIVHPDEMALEMTQLVQVAQHPEVLPDYTVIFGDPAQQEPDDILVNFGKALAAYQSTLVTSSTPFDRFRDALEVRDFVAAGAYPESAQRGLSLFLGRGNCSFCHSGALFTNGEFHDAGVGYFTDSGVDTGRFGGIEALMNSPYTLDGVFSDDSEKTGAWKVRQLNPQHGDFGTFRVPSLRNVALTAPYMHDGSLPDLASVVQHYSTINLERMHADGEAILVPLGLSDAESADLVAFLESLTEDQNTSDNP